MINKWIRLDNAAKIFPSAAGKANTLVFRFSCELYEPVDGVVLQEALEKTARQFEIFSYVMRRGLFWYYLEASDITPVVREEYKSPCSPLYERGQRSLLYEVTYYRSRINLEVYHALTDGTGALHFLELLVTKYLSLLHDFPEPMTDYDASAAQMGDDSFAKYSTGTRMKRIKHPKAFRIRGARYPENRISVICGTMPLNETVDASHRCGCTITAMLCGALMNAVAETMPTRAKSKPVVIGVPVNLRKYFPSVSARNFFAMTYVGHKYGAVLPTGIEDIAREAGAELSAQLNSDNLSAEINAHAAAERNVFARIAPLAFKDFVLHIAYLRSQQISSATLSNVGVIRVPDGLGKYIRSFTVYNGTNKIQACVCSCGNTLSVGFTSPFISADIQRSFFRALTSLGISVEISANRTGEN